MEWLTGYIIKICAAALISFVVDMLLPEGNIKRTARFCASLVITIIICAPLQFVFTAADYNCSASGIRERTR